MNSSLFSTSAIKMDSINFGNNKFYFNNSRKNINNSSKIKMNKSSCLKPYKKRHIINKNMKKRIKEFISTQKLPDIDSQLDKNKNNNGVDSIFVALNNVCKNIDVEELFKIAFGFGLSKKEIEALEKEYEKVQNDNNNEFIKQL